MQNLNDEELIKLVHENNEEAKKTLLDRYKNQIDYLIKKYTIIAKNLGIDITDLNQEAYLGFSDALQNYDHSKDASIKTFICLCVERRIKKSCLKAGTIKNQMLRDSLSLDYTYEEINLPLKELIEDVDSDPLVKITEKENYEELLKEIRDNLTDNERDVFELLIGGLNYKDIAVILDKEPKQIDNARERIKAKIKRIISERN